MEETVPSSTASPSTFDNSAFSVMGREETSVLLITCRTVFIIVDVVCTVFGNIISTIVIHRAPGFSDSVRVLMTSLCLADLGVGLALLSSVVSSGADRWLFGDPWCKVTAGLLAVCLSMSVFSLLGVSVDRLIAIRWPLRHPMLITMRRVKLGCIVLWVTSAAVATGNVMLHLEFTAYLPIASICYVDFEPSAGGIANEIFTATVLCVIPLGTIIAIYAILLRISAGHQRRLRDNVNFHANQANVSNQEAPPNRRIHDSGRGDAGCKRGAINRKAVTMFLVVSLGFTLCWAPHFAMRLHGSITGGVLPPWLQFVYVWLPMSNSFWNVIIYTLLNGSFRREVIKLLKGRRCCFKNEVVPQTNEESRGDHLSRLTY